MRAIFKGEDYEVFNACFLHRRCPELRLAFYSCQCPTNSPRCQSREWQPQRTVESWASPSLPYGKDLASSSSGLDSAVRLIGICLLYTSPSPRDRQKSRMPS